MFKEIRHVACERLEEANAHKQSCKPIFVSTLAVTGYPKLKLMLTQDSVFIRTQINVGLVREYLVKTDNAAPSKAMHPSQLVKKQKSESETPKEDDGRTPLPMDPT